MGRLVFVAALSPVFATVLALVVSASIMRRRPNGRATVTAVAPVLYVATVVAFAVVAGASVDFDPDRLGLWSPDRTALLAVACLAGVVVAVLGYLGELALADRSIRPVAGSGPTGMRAVTGWVASPWSLFTLGVTTAVAEEVLFRGFLLTGLRQDLPLWVAVVVQSALFGVHHVSFGWRAIPIKIGHGLVWSALTVLAGSLVPALVAHVLFQVLVCRRLVRRRVWTSTVGGGRDERARSTATV